MKAAPQWKQLPPQGRVRNRMQFRRWSSPIPKLPGRASPNRRPRSRDAPSALPSSPGAASGRAITLDRPEGLTKLIIDPKTERVLGVGIVGAGAGELIAEGVLAIEMCALAADVGADGSSAPDALGDDDGAAEVFYGQATDIYRPKK